MDCPECGTPDTRVKACMDDGREVKRKRECACGVVFFTAEETLSKTVRRRPLVNTNSHGSPANGEKPPPISTANPPVATGVAGGVGVGLSSGSVSGSDPTSGTSLPPDLGIDRPPARVSLAGSYLTERFKVIRAEYCQGLKWQSAKSHETASVMASELDGDEEAKADVVPTLRLMFEKAKAGKIDKSETILKDPSFAFGVWCSKFTALREELHGQSPAAPPKETNGPIYAKVKPLC